MARHPEQQRSVRRATPESPAATPETVTPDAQALLGNAAMQGLITGAPPGGVDPAALADGARRSGDAPAPFLAAATATGDLGFARAYLEAVRARRTQRPLGVNREEDEEEDQDDGSAPE
ncbi:MAG: hypothetical protein ACI8PZ_005077 [Myxococcota bacterium]|jgi:hypothetical protein